jgi:hypothetical protein
VTEKKKPSLITIKQTIRIRRIREDVPARNAARERIARILSRLRHEAHIINDSNRKGIANEGV